MEQLKISDPESLQQQIRSEMRKSPQSRYLHRLHCLLLVAKGHSCYTVAEWFDISPRTLELWVHRLEQRGVRGLRETTAAGRPARLNCVQLKALQEELAQPPSHYGYDAQQWSGALLRQHLSERYKSSFSLRQSQRLLRQLRHRQPKEQVEGTAKTLMRR